MIVPATVSSVRCAAEGPLSITTCAGRSARTCVHTPGALSTPGPEQRALTAALGHRRLVDAVEDLLRRSGGLARRRDLLAAGMSRRELARRTSRGELRQLTPHLYTDVAEPQPDEPLRAAAVALDGAVSHTSAALLWGLELAATPRTSDGDRRA